ncbi:MAG: hypothetical protein L0G19_01880 [Micrococcales bacterium]|nr:hypothetical protein [Micrococcales bacterium]
MPQPQDHAGSTDDQPRVPWARRSAAALGWVIGFAVAIGLVVAAVMIPTAFVVNTASADDGASDDASAMTEETELPDEAMQKVTLEAAASSGGSVEWEVDGQVETEEFSDSWSKEIQIPSGSWPRLVVTGDTKDSDLSLECSIKLDDEVIFEHTGTDSTKTASCSVFV